MILDIESKNVTVEAVVNVGKLAKPLYKLAKLRGEMCMRKEYESAASVRGIEVSLRKEMLAGGVDESQIDQLLDFVEKGWL